MPTPQSYKSHTRWDPPFHFFVLPMLLLNFIFSIYSTIHHWPIDPRLHIWWIIMAVVLFVMAGLGRDSAIRAQNRIIRLEERLRLARLLPAADQARIGGADHETAYRPAFLPQTRRTPSAHPQNPHPESRHESHQTKHSQLARRQRTCLKLAVACSPLDPSKNSVISTGGGAFCRRSGETPAFCFCLCRFSHRRTNQSAKTHPDEPPPPSPVPPKLYRRRA